MDLSDGLATDLPRLCAASEVGALIDPSALPAHSALADHPELLALQVSAGDDYQLLFTANPSQEATLRTLATEHAVQISLIGHLTQAPQVQLQSTAWPGGAFVSFGGAPPRRLRKRPFGVETDVSVLESTPSDASP